MLEPSTAEVGGAPAVSTCGALSAGHRAHIRDSRPLRGLTGEPIPAGSPPRVCGHVSALTYCTTMTACPSGLSVAVYQMVRPSDGR
jgi:hypothetical protein